MRKPSSMARQTGGTLVSSALAAMRAIVAARFDPAEWNIYAAQASDGDNSYSDGTTTGQLMRHEILPLCQYFAYIEVGEEDSDSSVSRSPLWMLYEEIRSELAAACPCARYAVETKYSRSSTNSSRNVTDRRWRHDGSNVQGTLAVSRR